MPTIDNVFDEIDHHEYPDAHLADSGIRFLNYILDTIGMYAFIFFVIYLLSESFSLGFYLETSDSPLLLLLYLLMPAYWVIFEHFFQKTPAKFLTKTKVVTINGYKPSFWNIVGRTLCRFIPFEQFSFLGSTPVGWHDSISKTRVVRDSYENQIS